MNIEDTWFQQDAATPHTAGAVIDWLSKTFGQNLILIQTAQERPPHLPDLNPLDFFPKRMSRGTSYITFLPANIDYHTFILYIK